MDKLVKEHGIDSSRLFNLDEVEFSPGKDTEDSLACKRLIHKNGAQDFMCSDFSYEDRLTVMLIIGADGDCAPPLFVMKGNRVLYRETLPNGTATPDTSFSRLPRRAVLAIREENGGVYKYNFLSWAWTFVEYTCDLHIEGRKVLLVYDSYRSHICLEVLGVFKATVL